MTTRDVLRLSIEFRYAYFALIFLPFFTLAAFGAGLFENVMIMFGVFGMVGSYAIDMNRARLFGLSRARIRKLRIAVAMVIAVVFVAINVPGYLVIGSHSLFFAMGGALCGLVLQLSRNPEENFSHGDVWYRSSKKVRGPAWDIVWKANLLWMILPPIFLAMFYFLNRGEDGNSAGIFGGLAGGLGAMVGGATVQLKNQFQVWSTFGRSSRSFYRNAWLSLGVTGLSFTVGVLAVQWIMGNPLGIADVALAVMIAPMIQVAILGGAFRKTKWLGVILAFIAMEGYLITGEILLEDAKANNIAALVVLTMVLWLVLSAWYIPHRLATRSFGSTGLRQMLGTDGKIRL